MRKRLGKGEQDVNIPRAQQRGAAPKLIAIRRQYSNRDKAMREAYKTGAYSYQQIAKEFGVHFTMCYDNRPHPNWTTQKNFYDHVRDWLNKPGRF